MPSRKRTCAFGLNSHHCALADLDKMMSSSEWLKSGMSPGKRSQQMIEDPDLVEKYERYCIFMNFRNAYLEKCNIFYEKKND